MLNTVLIGSLPLCSMLIKDLNVATNMLGLFVSNSDYKGLIDEEIKCPVFSPSAEVMKEQLPLFLMSHDIELVIVCGLSYRIPESTLKIPKYGFLNVHPGKLPQNRGADPVFWTIKNADKETAITVHQMDEQFDTGSVLYERKIPVVLGETYGILASKLILNMQGLVNEILQKMNNKASFQVQSSENMAYNPKPSEGYLLIDWKNQTSDEIEFLVNACNPRYGGATTYYQGAEIKILEVSQVSGQQPLFGRTAGEIVHAHPLEGLYVVCKYGQLLRVKTISTDAGVLSGEKYVNLGMQVGHKFTTASKQQNIEEVKINTIN